MCPECEIPIIAPAQVPSMTTLHPSQLTNLYHSSLRFLLTLVVKSGEEWGAVADFVTANLNGNGSGINQDGAILGHV